MEKTTTYYKCKSKNKNKDTKITTYYKLRHSTDESKDFYVGSTDDFEQRVKTHRKACNDIETTVKVDVYIRANDGFDNWEFDILERCRNESKQDRLVKEATYIKALKSKLNTHMPGTTHIDTEAKYYCGNCGQLLKGPGRSVAGVRSHHKYIKCRTTKANAPININGDNNTINIIYRYPE